MSMTFGSLFAGIGGFDIAFERSGMVCRWQVEIDDKCNQVLSHHWPGVRRYKNVKEVRTEDLESVDVICGGFPCQDLSVAGNRRGLRAPRSGLFFEMVRVIQALKPRWIVIENVPGFLSSHKGEDFAVALETLSQCGYVLGWRVLDAQYFGVAQRRRRVFIVGYTRDMGGLEYQEPRQDVSGVSRLLAEVLFESEGCKWDSPPSRETGQGVAAYACRRAQTSSNGWGIQEEVTHTLDNTGGDVVTAIRNSGRDADMRPGRQGTTTQDDVMFSLQAEQQHAVVIAQNGSDVQVSDKPGALTAGQARQTSGDLVAYNWQSGGDVRLSFGKPSLHCGQVPAVGVRRLTPTECERLQGFPDGHTAVNGMSDSARYRMLGNAVAVPVAEWIGRRIVEAGAL